jgi:hypothetical protein
MIRCLVSLLSILAIAGSAAPLQIGELLAMLKGETLSGEQVELPAADAGRKRVLVFSFSKAAGDDSRVWSQHLAKETGTDDPVHTFRVIMLESVPRLVRGMAVAGIRSGVPAADRNRTILVYKDEDSWKKRLAVTNDKYAYVILVDGKGRVGWIGSGPFTELSYSHLREALSKPWT